jgi:hypothetical protein
VTDVQTLLRDTFRAHEHETDGVDSLADAARARAERQRRRRTRLATVGAVVAVLAVTGGIALAANQRSAPAADVAAKASASATPTRVTSTDVPDGWRLVSNEGLEIAIPKGWPLISQGCDIPTRSTLIVTGGAGPSCGWDEPANLTIVRVEDIDLATAELRFAQTEEGYVSTRATEVDGLPAAERTSTLADGRTRLVLTVPDRRATLIAAGPDPALLRRVAGTARVFDVDLNGCTWQPPDPPSWDRVGAQQAVDVGQPTSVTVCNYAGTLVTSATLRGAQANSLVSALRNAKPGKSPDVPSTDCIDTGKRTVDLRIVLHGTGGDTPLDGYFSRCTDRYVASPTGVSQMTEKILSTALTPLHLGWSYPGPLPTG